MRGGRGMNCATYERVEATREEYNMEVVEMGGIGNCQQTPARAPLGDRGLPGLCLIVGSDPHPQIFDHSHNR
eukprot:2727418-Pyramimonas_sp.AAC.1